MIPVDMEFLKEDGHVGDCVRACTASLLGLPPSDVPHFVGDRGGDWRFAWEDWLESRGLMVLEMDPRRAIDCEHLACGPTKRPGGDCPAAHMVVKRYRNMIHDPHPSRAGIITEDRVYVIIPIKHLEDGT